MRDPLPTATQSHASKPFTPETTAASKPVKSHTQQKLQSQSQLLNHQQAKPVQQYQLPKTFKSRFNDSDDEGVDSLPTKILLHALMILMKIFRHLDHLLLLLLLPV